MQFSSENHLVLVAEQLVKFSKYLDTSKSWKGDNINETDVFSFYSPS